jgi:hypothetical protein
LLEPCVVGIQRPILLIPEGLADRLPPSQLASIVSHELAHLRRRDNFWASVHTVVETLFWFHPAVWLIERRLLDERERACDEDVLAAGLEPAAYAEAILNVCRHCMGVTLPSVAGVTGAHLAHRIENIVSHQRVQAVPGWKKAMLGGAFLAAVIGPATLGAATTAPSATSTVLADLALPAAGHPTGPTPAQSGPVPPARVARAKTTPSLSRPATRLGLVSGVVTNTLGDALANVMVEVASDDSNGRTLTVKTSANGAFKVKDLAPGVYTVVFRLDEYVTFKREGLIVRAATDAVVNPVMKDGFYGG